MELKWNLQFHFNSGQFHFAIPIPIPWLRIPIPELTPTLNQTDSSTTFIYTKTTKFYQLSTEKDKDLINITRYLFAMVKHWCGVVVDELVVTETEWRIYASMNWAITASDNGLSPDWRQTIIGINAGILLIRPSGTNFSEILIEIHFHSRKCIWKCRMENSGLSELASLGAKPLPKQMMTYC